jgi:hypothetical protein
MIIAQKVVGAKHWENNLGQNLIIYRPNASPLQESRFKSQAYGFATLGYQELPSS